MNYTMINRLVRKEWHFSWFIFSVLVSFGVVALILTAVAAKLEIPLLRFISFILLYLVFNLLMWTPVATIGSERADQTLAFLVSLPITIKEYTAAKIISSISIFLAGWLLLAAGTIGLNLLDDGMSNAYIPLTLIVLVQAFVLFCLFVVVTLVMESGAWTMVVGVVGNIVFWLSFAFIGVAPGMGDPEATWSKVWWLLPAELAAIPVIIGLAIYFQSRKTDFLK